MRSRYRQPTGHRLPADELAELARQIEAVQTELAARQAELAELEQDLEVFQRAYDQRVGALVSELERVERDLAECKRRIDFYRQWGAGGPPKTRSGRTYVPVDEQFRRTWRQPPPPGDTPRSWSEVAKRVHPADAPLEKRIRQLYRRLCRRFHPDLVQDAGEKQRRTEITAAINAAYAQRLVDARQSMAELQALDEQATLADWEVGGTADQRLVALRARLTRLRDQLASVERAVRTVVDSPAARLSLETKLARRQGRDLLGEIQAEVESDLARKRVELDFVRAQLHELGLSES